jgi:hypothetical protein
LGLHVANGFWVRPQALLMRADTPYLQTRQDHSCREHDGAIFMSQQWERTREGRLWGGDFRLRFTSRNSAVCFVTSQSPPSGGKDPRNRNALVHYLLWALGTGGGWQPVGRPPQGILRRLRLIYLLPSSFSPLSRFKGHVARQQLG